MLLMFESNVVNMRFTISALLATNGGFAGTRRLKGLAAE
jgi:hypothetical protein